MLWNAGLSVGTSFAEFSARNSEGQTTHKRWYLPKSSLQDGLQAIFQENPQVQEAHLKVSTQTAEFVVEKRRGGPLAWLGTSGVENWPLLTMPASRRQPSLSLARPEPFVEPEFMFGLPERTRVNGEREKQVSEEDLAFVIAKLEMAKVKHVAVGFLHSLENPDNERWVSEKLTEKGLLVSTSHSHARCRDVVSRWRLSILDAYVAHELVELEKRLSQIQESLPQIKSLELARGYSPYLSQSEVIRQLARNHPSGTILHLGLEQFVLVTPHEMPQAHEVDACLLQAELPRFHRLQIQPTQVVTTGAWQTPGFGDRQSGYEPGPMIFGKSLVLTLLDVLSLSHGRKALSAFDGLLSEKAEKRIAEALYTESKTHTLSPQLEVQQMAHSLEELALEQIAQDLLSFGVEREIYCTGAFAAMMMPALKKRLPQFKWSKGQEFVESLALLQSP